MSDRIYWLDNYRKNKTPKAVETRGPIMAPYTEEEKKKARKLIAEAKRKAGLNVEVIEKRKPHEPIKRSMAQLLSDAKRCFSYYSQWDEQCPQEFKSWESNQNIKCHWCEKFEQQRNAETVNEARHILEGKK